MARVLRVDGRWALSGTGFGNFVPARSWRAVRHLLPNVLARTLLKKHGAAREVVEAGLSVTGKMGRALDFDCVKNMLSLDLVRSRGALQGAKNVAVIGDGFGFMAGLVKTILPNGRVISINLGKMSFFDVYHLSRAFPQEGCLLAKDATAAAASAGFVFLEAESAELLATFPVDLFINIASMQEMDMPVVEGYFAAMRASPGARYFYCCNRMEKILPDGSPIRFDAYPWAAADKVLVDGLCPWYEKFPTSTPPFWRRFDAPLHHRLAKLAP